MKVPVLQKNITKYFKYICFYVFVPVALAGQSLSIRMNDLRVVQGRLYWDVEIQRSDDWGSSINGSALGHADFYFYVNIQGLASGAPELANRHLDLNQNANYTFKTGRTIQKDICWLAMSFDPLNAGFPWSPGLNVWERMGTLSLPINDPNEMSGLHWHSVATGCLKGDMQSIQLNLIDPADILLLDDSIPFTDITSNKLGIVGSGNHAPCFVDITNDQYPDLYITRYLTENISELFYRNRFDSSFIEEASLRGIHDSDGGSHGAVFADFDNDGDYDLFNGTTRESTGGSVQGTNNIFQNDGNGYFTEKTSTIVDIKNSQLGTRGVTALDIEGDGDLDIFTVTGYLGSDDPSGDRMNELFINQGNWQFTRRTSGTAVNAPCGQGVIDTDYDNDGDIDILAANRTGDVNILQNDGTGQFTLRSPIELGISHRAGDGISVGDIDQDGDQDLLLITDNSGYAYLYENVGGTFSWHQTLSIKNGYMGGFADLDNDCDLDLVFTHNGSVFLNDGNGHFGASSLLPITNLIDPRSVSFADIDLDGDLDFMITDKQGSGSFVRNDMNQNNYWLKIKLETPDGQAGAFGAKVRIYAAGTSQLLGFREANGAHGYLAQDDPILHFGLGSHMTADVIVDFPDGKRATRKTVFSNQIYTIKQADIYVYVPIKVFLEGAYNVTGDTMQTDLNYLEALPLQSPYGDGAVAGYLNGVFVDWVMVELKATIPGPVIIRKAGLLTKDGLIVDWDRPNFPLTMNALAGNYYIIVKHRNHLPIRTATSVALNDQNKIPYDFTTSITKYDQQSGALELSNGVWVMIAGNSDDQDNAIYASDLAEIRSNQSISSGRYHNADVDLDGVVDNADYTLVRKNMLGGFYSVVEK